LLAAAGRLLGGSAPRAAGCATMGLVRVVVQAKQNDTYRGMTGPITLGCTVSICDIPRGVCLHASGLPPPTRLGAKGAVKEVVKEMRDNYNPLGFEARSKPFQLEGIVPNSFDVQAYVPHKELDAATCAFDLAQDFVNRLSSNEVYQSEWKVFRVRVRAPDPPLPSIDFSAL